MPALFDDSITPRGSTAVNPTNRLLAALTNHNCDPKVGSDGWSAKCPAHDDQRASLSVSNGKNGGAVVHCFANCTPESIVHSLGMTMADLMGPAVGRSTVKATVVATHDYRDESGNLLSQVVRYEPKDFRQRRPKADGSWDWSTNAVRRVPYRLPELLIDTTVPVYVVEGEKDVDALAAIGLAATCNSGGAGKWTKEHAKHLAGRHVIVVPDNDEAGRSHAQQVAKSLAGIAASIKIVELPGLPSKGDMSDWLAAGGTRDALELLTSQTPVWTPKSDSNSEGTTQLRRAQRPRPFPIDALPVPVSEFVREAANAIGCDPSYIALPMIACLSRAIGNSRKIALKQSWSEFPIVWGAIIGKSGTHKSPALIAATQYLVKKQSDEFANYEARLDEFKQDKAMWERDFATWKRSTKTSLGLPPVEPEAPLCRRYVCNDTTIEALVDRLHGQFDGVLVVRDELAGWLDGMGEYKGGRGSDTAHWLASWSGAPLTVDRKTGGNQVLHIPRAAVSIVGGIQPGILRRAIGREHMQDGLCARLLLTMPEPRPVQWSEAVVSPETEAKLAAVMDRLITLPKGRDPNEKQAPIRLPLTPEAKAAWVEYYNRHRAELSSLDDDLAAAWSKLEAYAARFALIVQLCAWAAGDASETEVDQASMEAGIRLSDWFGYEARRVYEMLADDAETADQRELVELARRQGGSLTARQLMRATRKYPNAADAEAALESLKEAGYGRWVLDDHDGGKGQPTRRLTLVDALTVDTNGPELEQVGNCVSVSGPQDDFPNDDSPPTCAA